MKDGGCSKRFPKSFCEETSVDQSGYPVYRRRSDGRAVVKDGHILDNRWVVPHNVALLKRYQAHLNVEWCNKTNLVKYLFKYITKGPDRANVVVRPTGGTMLSVKLLFSHLSVLLQLPEAILPFSDVDCL
jgi:hypothetical protein